jgi:putative membrane-bound dehydrogenase-like protein
MPHSAFRFARLAIFSGFLALPLSSAFAEPALPEESRLQSSPVLRHLKKNPISVAPKTDAERTVAQMYVPEGFRVEVVAAEPDLHQPVAFAFDERGRIWVAEAYSYPTKRPAGEGLDKIVIFEDRDGDGKFETKKIFAEGLNLVSGFEVGFGGVWVGAAPELLFIPDKNHDDIPDGPPQILLNGFGFQDTHECLNSFLWGPDGWLYGNQGVFNFAKIGKPGAPDSERTELRAGVWRYHPTRHLFEVFAHGGSNPWGLDYDERGQMFMTHCRSYWGRGLTTHVIQNGHFWNQANANHAPFIIGNPPAKFPEFRNYLLASARYDHGAGGAGIQGSDAIYGGHSHVGTMIYLGDNWPDQFRGHLFTHNLGGHQMNQQINERLGSGFNTVHAGKDQFFCTDPKYVAVDLQYGPDGAVYMIDWYDQQHCHNPNTERWDRGNGRLYRMEYSATYMPRKVDLASMTDTQLVDTLGSKNQWYGRTARRLLQERKSTGQIDPAATKKLSEIVLNGNNSTLRLRALWTLHGIDSISDEIEKQLFGDKDEYLRAWMVQLSAANGEPSASAEATLVEMAKSDGSPVVRLYLASALPRLSESTAWRIIEALSRHGEDKEDRNLPILLWQGLAARMVGNLDRAFSIASSTPIASLTDWIHWYAATLNETGLNRAVAELEKTKSGEMKRRLAGLWLAMEPRSSVTMPVAWKSVSANLYGNSDVEIRRDAEKLAAVFGDESIFTQLRKTLADKAADESSRQHAFEVLGRARDRASLPVFLEMLDDAKFRAPAIGLLARYDSPEVATALIARFNTLPDKEKSAVLNALTSRATFALSLLDAIAANKIKRDQITSFYVRQLTELRDPGVDKRVAANWGQIAPTSDERKTLIAALEKTFDEAPLWAYDAREGRRHFQKLCAQCHRIGEEGARLGPELTGAGKHGIRYFLENVVDPNAVIGVDFQMTTLETKSGDLVSGIIASETPSTITIRAVGGETSVSKTDIARRSTSDKSLMPEGLLDSLSPREQLELLKFLTSN